MGSGFWEVVGKLGCSIVLLPVFGFSIWFIVNIVIYNLL